jgi:hypothetical protein
MRCREPSGLPRNSALTIIFWCFLGTILRATPAGAQSLNSNNFFAGYSYTQANVFSGQHPDLNGWNVSLEKRYFPSFGIVLDASGHYGPADIIRANCTATVPSGCLVNSSVNEHLFQFGVRAGYAAERFRPFGEILFGAAVIDQNGPGVTDRKSVLAETLGGGVDLRIYRRLAWRLEADLVQTGSFVPQNRSLRASTGLAIHF